MTPTIVIFYIFAAILIASALRVITAKNPVHAALSLVLSFFTGAVLWMLIEAEFLAISLVLVYVGAVMVLFLFVVMMLDINFEELRKDFWSYFPIAGAVAAIMAAEMVMVLVAPETGLASLSTVAPLPEGVSNIKQLGVPIYTDYVLPFELAAVLLLVAMIAAVSLTLRRRKNTKYVNPADQIKVKRNDRVRIVKMDAVIEQPEVPAADEAGNKPAA
ncbi:NADH-quinone oxidoreductase subunit J [Chitinimonas sp. BJB300]|uniref:NADH-quinone oxidoreductase subunit J n=1 Tax=Chitinimonas sp. BJB300 TaxID=1559339 RepID=UPI000C0CB1A7|nr:NADH-quinone oxidoreductase subunit J [Chitinimonas sp. BJB300]PHV10798.1 NADH:ubiquinone oxidoreductase subunit J [Chitinimonas sp. BJB300]TSJ87795.1 NADH-quinone oxidoreductase subunit J [Chitinimonas sp. BJB300]